MSELKNAIAILLFQPGQYTLDSVKSIYRKLANKHHPDKGGNTESMQLINQAFDIVCEHFKTNDTLNVDQQMKPVNIGFLDSLKQLAGVIIEICGLWVWLYGNTHQHRVAISTLGFRFSGAKKMWYWSPTLDPRKLVRGTKSIKTIRDEYGSIVINTHQMSPALN